MPRVTRPRTKKAPLSVTLAQYAPGSLGAWVAAYLEALRVKNYSPRTVENRAVYLTFLVAWCEARAIVRPADVTRPLLERYQRSLYYLRKPNGQPLSFRSQFARLVPVRALFRWLCRQNVLLSNPASELELPRAEKRLPKHVLTVEEAEAVLSQPRLSTAVGVRDRAILEVFYSTGMRRSELVNLSVFDVDGERRTVMIRRGKGGKDRMVPIGERALVWLDKYVQGARAELVTSGGETALFVTHLGERFTPDRMSQLVREYVDRAELGKRGSCHLFRHTMATLMLEHGADVRYIQEMLGHAELSTTQIYTQVSIRRLVAIHAATHPGASVAGAKRASAAETALVQEPGPSFAAVAVVDDDE